MPGQLTCQVHPLHKEIVGFLKDIRSERRVVDYESLDSPRLARDER